MDTGKVISFVIPSGGKVLGFLGRGGELVIEWDRIRKIGLDVILVDDAGLTL
jgi:YlmC/YmxH family sporulation protein